MVAKLELFFIWDLRVSQKLTERNVCAEGDGEHFLFDFQRIEFFFSQNKINLCTTNTNTSGYSVWIFFLRILASVLGQVFF